jgi:hypothetical protein
MQLAWQDLVSEVIQALIIVPIAPVISSHQLAAATALKLHPVTNCGMAAAYERRKNVDPVRRA